MFYGVVEDRHDPLKIGRVRVRIHGYHTHDKQMISTPDLPWCQVILPTTSTGHSGFGSQHGLTEGTNVIGFFRDKAMQDPVITGVVAGISSEFSRIEGEKNIKPKVDDGFNDPRRLKKRDYRNTPDGENPKHSSIRGFGLEGSLEHAPKLPKKVEVTYEAEGSTLENPTLSNRDLPYYPLERTGMKLILRKINVNTLFTTSTYQVLASTVQDLFILLVGWLNRLRLYCVSLLMQVLYRTFLLVLKLVVSVLKGMTRLSCLVSSGMSMFLVVRYEIPLRLYLIKNHPQYCTSCWEILSKRADELGR